MLSSPLQRLSNHISLLYGDDNKSNQREAESAEEEVCHENSNSTPIIIHSECESDESAASPHECPVPGESIRSPPAAANPPRASGGHLH